LCIQDVLHGSTDGWATGLISHQSCPNICMSATSRDNIIANTPHMRTAEGLQRGVPAGPDALNRLTLVRSITRRVWEATEWRQKSAGRALDLPCDDGTTSRCRRSPSGGGPRARWMGLASEMSGADPAVGSQPCLTGHGSNRCRIRISTIAGSSSRPVWNSK
jgi:hypothetical protein